MNNKGRTIVSAKFAALSMTLAYLAGCGPTTYNRPPPDFVGPAAHFSNHPAVYSPESLSQLTSPETNASPTPSPGSASNQENIQAACDQIFAERARLQNVALVGPQLASTALMVIAMRARVNNDLAALDQQYAHLNCASAYQHNASMSLDDCMAQCAARTQQSRDACFNVCSVGR